MRVLMVGATGRHAHLVLRELTKRGVAVRALVRNQSRKRESASSRGRAAGFPGQVQGRATRRCLFARARLAAFGPSLPVGEPSCHRSAKLWSWSKHDLGFDFG
jgi:uncharacterized protein YbjT (DUF2867 family)